MATVGQTMRRLVWLTFIGAITVPPMRLPYRTFGLQHAESRSGDCQRKVRRRTSLLAYQEQFSA